MAALGKDKLGIIYIDMDNVIVDFKTGIKKIKPTLTAEQIKFYDDNNGWDEVPGIFGLMEPVAGAIDAIEKLSKNFDVYILSTAPWKNHTAWNDKNKWVRKHFEGIDNKGHHLHKRLILSHHKDLHVGDWLIDDRKANGAAAWGDKLIQFGPADPKEDRAGDFPDWKSVLAYFDEIVASSQPR
jgi:5'(3')-deoxyribonucleotidase